jgi:hypothetical protein
VCFWGGGLWAIYYIAVTRLTCPTRAWTSANSPMDIPSKRAPSGVCLRWCPPVRVQCSYHVRGTAVPHCHPAAPVAGGVLGPLRPARATQPPPPVTGAYEALPAHEVPGTAAHQVGCRELCTQHQKQQKISSSCGRSWGSCWLRASAAATLPEAMPAQLAACGWWEGPLQMLGGALPT